MANYLPFSLLLLFLFSLLHPLSAGAAQPTSPPSPASFPQTRHSISAVFAFGDSTLDAGNNNHLPNPTFVRADHPPYGRDFPGGISTGRFSNGRLITDSLVAALGLKDSLPSFLAGDLTPLDLLTGVSFASAGSGLDDLTAIQSGVMTVAEQLSNFAAYLGLFNGSAAAAAAAPVIRNALFIVGAGSNDMMMNFYMLPTRRAAFTVAEYHGLLLDRMQALITNLYSMGARRFTVAGLPPLGCIPLQRTMASISSSFLAPPFVPPRPCVKQQNDDAVAYNERLQKLLASSPASLAGSKIAYVDIYNPLMDMINKPSTYGFTEVTKGCCGSGTMEMGPLCSMPIPTCQDPSKFMFWDSVHPSQAAYEALATQFMANVLPQVI